MLNNPSNQPWNFRTKTWIEIDDESRGTYNVNSQIKFKTTMLKSNLCDYSDAYILDVGNITVNIIAAAYGDANNTNKNVILKNCASFTNFISKINNAQINHAKYIDTVMTMFNLIKCSDNYSKTSGSLWQFCKDIPAVDNNGNIAGFDGANTTNLLIFKGKITGQTDGNGGMDNVEIMVTLKHLSSFWRILEMLLILKLILFWLGLQILISSILMLKIKILHLK